MFNLNRLNIGPRLGWMLALQAVLMLAIGAAGLVALDRSSTTSAYLSTEVGRVSQNQRLLSMIEGELMQTLHRLNIGSITWSDGRDAYAKFETEFNAAYTRFMRDMKDRSGTQERKSTEEARTLFGEAMAEIHILLNEEDRGFLEEFLINESDRMIRPLITALTDAVKQARTSSEQALVISQEEKRFWQGASGSVLLAALLAAVGFGVAVTRSIRDPVRRISRAVEQVSQGDNEARVGLESPDEIGQLARTFDTLLDERVATLAETEREAEQLNDSVISLLRAVSALSDRDLTVHVPVTEDATGPVADAVNQMASETAAVLKQVLEIAEKVERATLAVNGQATTVDVAAQKQSQEIEQTASALAEVSDRLNAIAETAMRANKIADLTTRTTKSAAKTVRSTQLGMGRIRETIQETGKRIKRLGERTQEISGIVDVINGIAERTTVLALNASMQAASAGEAGRGFAVVADEVQRLAESSRKATEQIAALVKNIVAETNDTMSIMDRTIGHVVDGSQEAEKAALEMVKTVKTTGFLVKSVDEIAIGTSQQAKLATVLRAKADSIREQTTETSRQVAAQLEQTRHLVEYADSLVGAVSVFNLPAD